MSFNQFYTEINTSSRKDMIAFLAGHARYYTESSWNRTKSYSNNIKIDRLAITGEQKNKLYELLSVENIRDYMDDVLDQFRDNHNGAYVIGSNGHSGGYLVLYKSHMEPLEFKSYCTNCHQRNYKLATETDCKCGRCGANTRVNLTHPIYRCVLDGPVNGTDTIEDYEDWTDDELKDIVEIVMDFDRACDDFIECALQVAEEYVIKEETRYVPETVNVLVPKK